MRRLAKSLAPILAIVLLWALFFWRVITPVEADRLTFQQGDFTLQFLAYRQLAFNQFVQGHFPVIEDCLYSGHPFQADPQAQVLYPPVLAIMLIGRALGWTAYPLRALEWEVMLHVLLAALGMVAFLRSGSLSLWERAGVRAGVVSVRRIHPIACVFGALAFAFGGFITGYAMLQTAILQMAAWLPLILLALKWLATARRWLPAAALLAVLVFFAFTAGHPQTLLFIVYAGALAFVWWSWTKPDRSSRPVRFMLVRALVAGVFAIGLSAAQLLPTLSFMLASTRASLPFEKAGTGFTLHDISLFALAGVTNVWQPLFSGISALAMAGVALFASARVGARAHLGMRTTHDDTWLWVVIGVGALVLSFGANAFGFDLAYLIAPGYRQFQSQERHAVIIALCVGVLSAYGVNALMRPLRRRARLQLRKAAKALALWATIAFAAMLAVLLAGRALPEANMGDAADKVALIALGLLGTAALFAWRVRIANLTGLGDLSGFRPRTLWGIAVLALLVFELFSANRMTAMQKPADPFPPNALITPIQQDATYAAQFTRVYNHFGLPLNGACVRGLNEVAGGSPIVMRDYKTFLERAPEDVMIKLLNVRHAVTWRGAMTTPEGKTIPWFLLARDSFEGKEASTYRLDWEPKSFNGAWIAKDVRVASGDAMFEAMRRDGFDPFATVFVAAPTPNPSPQRGGEQGSAAIEGKTAGYIKVAANVNAPALLVISQAYHWNWTATVNGIAVTPVVVDSALLGVPIPAGVSSVELSYRPMELIAGAAISAITLLIMVVALIFNRRQTERLPKVPL